MPSVRCSLKQYIQFPGPEAGWPFESKLPTKSLTTRVSFENGKKVGKLFDEAN